MASLHWLHNDVDGRQPARGGQVVCSMRAIVPGNVFVAVVAIYGPILPMLWTCLRKHRHIVCSCHLGPRRSG